MIEPASLSATALGATVLAEGIKFLYNQAGELIKRWREKKDKSSEDRLSMKLPTCFTGQLNDVEIDSEKLKEVETELQDLHKELSAYVNKIVYIDPKDKSLLQLVHRLRLLLEMVFKQHITFTGENRPISGTPIVEGIIEAETISGNVIGAETDEISEGQLSGKIEAKEIKKGGRIVGAKAKSIGKKRM